MFHVLNAFKFTALFRVRSPRLYTPAETMPPQKREQSLSEDDALSADDAYDASGLEKDRMLNRQRV